MEPGDIFVALSDGVVDAESAGRRAIRHRARDRPGRPPPRGSAAELMAALREALADFTGAVPADDDRTGVIVKRSY